MATLQAKIAECCCETQKALLVQSNAIQVLELNIENKRLQALANHNHHVATNGNIEIAITNVLRNLKIA